MSFNVSAILQKLAEVHAKKKIIFRDKELTPEKAFALDGGLPLLVKRANLLCDFLFNEKLQVSLRSEPGSLTGDRVEINPNQLSFMLVMLLYDVFEELVVNAGKGNITLS